VQHPEPHFEKILLTEAEAAQAIGFSSRFLQERRFKGGGPPFVKVSARAVRYRPSDLEAWAEARVRTSTSDRGPDAAP
jgi:predicted DNA-binding transcriptional regulator AlpA